MFDKNKYTEEQLDIIRIELKGKGFSKENIEILLFGGIVYISSFIGKFLSNEGELLNQYMK